MKYALLLSAVLVTASAHAQAPSGVTQFLEVSNSEAVVYITDAENTAGGTGTCISSNGLFLTAKHCVESAPEGIAVFRDGTKVPVKSVWMTDAADGPALMQATNTVSNLPAASLGSSPPNGKVYSIGYPFGNFTATEGTSAGSSYYRREGTKIIPTDSTEPPAIRLNIINFDSSPGSSGSPVFDGKDELVGVVIGGASNGSTLAATYGSLEEVKQTMAGFRPSAPTSTASPPSKPVLVAIGASYCGPCIQFKNRLAHDESFSKEVYARCEYVHLDISNPLEVPRAVQYGFRMGIDEVPTFLLIHNRTLIGKMVGYGDPDEFLAWLDSNTQKIVGQAAPQQPPTQTPQEPVVVDGGDSDPVADLIENGDEFTGVTIVLLIAEQVKAEEGTLKDKVLGYTAAAWERLLRDVFSKHDVAIASISERADPERYALACQTFGVDPEKGYLLVGVPKTNQGFSKGLMVKMIESKVGAKVETYGAPVDVIFERSDRVHYQQLLDIVAMVPQTSSPYDLSWKGWIPQLVIGAIGLLFGERVMIYVMFVLDKIGIIFQSPITWVKNRRSPTQDTSVPPPPSTPQGKPDDGIVIE